MSLSQKTGVFLAATAGSYLVLLAVFKFYCLAMGHDMMEWIFGTYCAYVFAVWAGTEIALIVQQNSTNPTGRQPRIKLSHALGLS